MNETEQQEDLDIENKEHNKPASILEPRLIVYEKQHLKIRTELGHI